MKNLGAGLLALLVGFSCADPGDVPEDQCVPGAQVACACVDGSRGVQVCQADGLGFEACTGCAASTGTTSGSGATGSGSSGATQASTSANATGASSSSTGVEPMMFVLDDSLGPATVGHTVGGTLTDAGWRVDARTDRIWFDIPRLVEGEIAFTITGMSNGANNNMPQNDMEIFTMYEAGYGIAEPIRYAPEYRNNFFKAMIRVYGNEPGREGQQKLLWINCAGGAPGYSEDSVCPCGSSFADEPWQGNPTWDGSPVRLRLVWNEDGATLYKNDELSVGVDWSSSTPFGPDTVHFALGSARADAVDTAGMPIGAVFSDLHVEGWTGNPASCVP